MQNQEIMLIQMIEKQIQDEALKNICRQIGQKHQNPRLLIFLKEFLTSLFDLSPSQVHAGIGIINTILQGVKNFNRDIKSILEPFVLHQKADLLALFYETAFMSSYEEAYKCLMYNHFRAIIVEAQSKVGDQINKALLEKIDLCYRSKEQDFEVDYMNHLDQNEQDRLMQLIADNEAKPPPQKSQSYMDKLLQSLPLAIRDRMNQVGVLDDLLKFRTYLGQDSKPESRDLASSIWFANFVDKLIWILQQYSTIRTAKIKVNDIQKLIDDLQKEYNFKKKPEPQELLIIERIKYFYKFLKNKKLNGDQRQGFQNYQSMRMKLLEYTKQVYAQANLPKSTKQLVVNKSWKQNYTELYLEIGQAKAEDAERLFGLLLSFQQLMLAYFRYRWNYIYLFYAIIDDCNIPKAQLENVIDMAFEQMWNTPRNELTISYLEIVNKFNEKAKTKIQTIQIDTYQHIQLLEIHLTTLNNKLLLLHLKQRKVFDIKGQAQLFTDLPRLELIWFQDCNDQCRGTSFYQRILDSVVGSDKEEKEILTDFLQSYHKFSQKLQFLVVHEKGNKSQAQTKIKTYKANIKQFKEDFDKKVVPGYEFLRREYKISRNILAIIDKEIETHNDLFVKELLNSYKELFLKDNPFIFFIPSTLKSLAYQSKKLIPVVEKIERHRYLLLAYQDQDISVVLNSMYKSGTEQQNELDIQKYSLEQQFNMAKSIYNYYIEQQYISSQNQQVFRPFTDTFPEIANPQDLLSYNTPQFNFACYFINKVLPIESRSIKNEITFAKEFNKLNDAITQRSQIENSENPLKEICAQYYDLKNYKNGVIKEISQLQGVSEKLTEIFSKYSQLQKLKNEVIRFKSENKIACNDTELFACAQSFWAKIFRQEHSNLHDADSRQKVEQHYKSIFNSNSYAVIAQTIQQYIQGQSTDAIVKQMLNANYDLFQKEMEKYYPKPSQLIKPRLSLVVSGSVAKKLYKIKQDPKFKDFQSEDPQTEQYIQEQFEYFMKNFMGKIFQVVLTQKVGDEFKVYQNKSDTVGELQPRYKQLQEMQRIYGPQKDSNFDMVLLTAQEPKVSFQYSLCDLTPAQRQSEFRKFLTDIEPIQDDVIRNKIRKGIWKDQHPQLADVLTKKIKRGTDLWDQVQDFLSNRESRAIQNEDDEQEDAPKQQVEGKDISNLRHEIQDKLKRSIHLQSQQNIQFMQTKLKNMESNNHLMNQKEVSIRTVQFVLEEMPLFKKSKILYKSYLF